MSNETGDGDRQCAAGVAALTAGDPRTHLRQLGPTWIAGAIAAGPATVASLLTAFESDELGVDDAVSRAERAALGALADWADRRVRLPGDA
jgi:manganese transport protein